MAVVGGKREAREIVCMRVRVSESETLVAHEACTRWLVVGLVGTVCFLSWNEPVKALARGFRRSHYV